jgi:hypothetical protein
VEYFGALREQDYLDDYVRPRFSEDGNWDLTRERAEPRQRLARGETEDGPAGPPRWPLLTTEPSSEVATEEHPLWCAPMEPLYGLTPLPRPAVRSERKVSWTDRLGRKCHSIACGDDGLPVVLSRQHFAWCRHPLFGAAPSEPSQQPHPTQGDPPNRGAMAAGSWRTLDPEERITDALLSQDLLGIDRILAAHRSMTGDIPLARRGFSTLVCFHHSEDEPGYRQARKLAFDSGELKCRGRTFILDERAPRLTPEKRRRETALPPGEWLDGIDDSRESEEDAIIEAIDHRAYEKTPWRVTTRRVTLDVVATKLGTTKRSVHRLISAGLLPRAHREMGHEYRILGRGDERTLVIREKEIAPMEPAAEAAPPTLAASAVDSNGAPDSAVQFCMPENHQTQRTGS